MSSRRASRDDGAVVVSVDAELGWGFIDWETVPVERVEGARRGWSTLVKLFEEHEVPATWAVVGHLFLDDCEGEHAEHPVSSSWFTKERSVWGARPDLRFGGDLVESLLDSSVDHDIGCHSFSHVEFGASETTSDVARAEIRASIDAAAPFDVDFHSFVFPRNNVGNRQVLAEEGFSCYRGAAQSRGRVAEVFDKLAGVFVDRNGSSLIEPQVDKYGLVNVPPSFYLFGFEGVARTAIETIADDPIVIRTRRAVERAAQDGGIVHIWLHPNNLRSVRDVRRIDAVLDVVSQWTEISALTVETMEDVATQVRSRKKTTAN